MNKIQEDEIRGIAMEAARSAVKEIREEMAKNEKKSNFRSSMARATKEKLRCYRRMKEAMKDTEEFTDDEKTEFRWKFIEDLMGSSMDLVEKAENRVVGYEERRRQNAYSLYRLEKAVDFYEKEGNKQNNEETRRRVREIRKIYMDPEETEVKDVATLENVSEKTVYRDIEIAANALSAYLLAI